MNNLMNKINSLDKKKTKIWILPVGKAKPASRPFSLINIRFIFSNRSLIKNKILLKYFVY
jgi:hypothetical protein